MQRDRVVHPRAALCCEGFDVRTQCAVHQMRRGLPGEEAKPVKRCIVDGAVNVHQLGADSVLGKTFRRRSQPLRHAAEPARQQFVAQPLRAVWP